MRNVSILLIFATLLFAQEHEASTSHQNTEAQSSVLRQSGSAPSLSLLNVKRVYVDKLTGGVEAARLRDLIIASLHKTNLFVLTDNPDRADAVLKGAADDQAFTDTFDSDEAMSNSGSGGAYKGTSSRRGSGGYLGMSANERDSIRIRERKHEAYASVRLCNLDGDVIWSTTQESLGAKFRGASADVAAKISRQLTLDMEKARKVAQALATGSASQSP